MNELLAQIKEVLAQEEPCTDQELLLTTYEHCSVLCAMLFEALDDKAIPVFDTVSEDYPMWGLYD